MKILYIIGYPRPFTGSQRSCAALIKRLPAWVEHLALFPGEGSAVDGFRNSGVNTRILPAGRALTTFGKALVRTSLLSKGWIALRHWLPYTWRLLRLIRHERPDIIHCNDQRAVLMAGLAARLARLPLIWHIRGKDILKESFFYYRGAHLFSTCAVTVAHALESEVEPSLRVQTIHNGIDPQEYSDDGSGARQLQAGLAARGLRREEAFCLVTCSSLVPYKGHHWLLQACHQVKAATPGKKLIWIILAAPASPLETKYQAHLQTAAKRLHLAEHLIWAGWQENVFSWMRAADVVVLPTTDGENFVFEDGENHWAECAEGLPRTILESLVAARPVIATDVAGVSECVENGVTGLVVPPRDAQAMAAAIQRLMNSPDLQQSMSREAAAAAAPFSVERCVSAHLALYAEFVPARSRVPGRAATPPEKMPARQPARGE